MLPRHYIQNEVIEEGFYHHPRLAIATKEEVKGRYKENKESERRKRIAEEKQLTELS